MLKAVKTGEDPICRRRNMKRFEIATGSAMWAAVSLLMAAAALEPVAVHANPGLTAQELATGLDSGDKLARHAASCDGTHL
jgi:hypothetical protein